jgi:hypothetical protein
LEEKNGPLSRSPPDELAALPLAVLDVHVTARVLEAAVLEDAIYKDAVVQDYMLIFECPVLIASHRKACDLALMKERARISGPYRIPLALSPELNSRHHWQVAPRAYHVNVNLINESFRPFAGDL